MPEVGKLYRHVTDTSMLCTVVGIEVVNHPMVDGVRFKVSFLLEGKVLKSTYRLGRWDDDWVEVSPV